MNTDNRTDDELNRIIAEWMGWNVTISAMGSFHWRAPDDSLVMVTSSDPPFEWPWPNYCRNLNALREACNVLPEHDRFETEHGIYGSSRCAYTIALYCTVNAMSFDAFQEPLLGMTIDAMWDVSNATARQRAEALIRIIEITTTTNNH